MSKIFKESNAATSEFSKETRLALSSASHWNERELEALCQGIPPAKYSDICTPDTEWKPIRKAITDACANGRLHAEPTNAGNVVYGGQWRIERVSAQRWAICMGFLRFPEWLVAHDLQAIWKRQDDERLLVGRYTLREAIETIARNTGESLEELEHKIVQNVRDGILPVHRPGERQTYRPLTVRVYYEEAYWDDLNTWLEKKEKRITFRFPQPDNHSDRNALPSTNGAGESAVLASDETASNGPEIAVVSEPDQHSWKPRVKELAVQKYLEAKSKGWGTDKSSIAREVEKECESLAIRSHKDKPLTASYIARHALTPWDIPTSADLAEAKKQNA